MFSCAGACHTEAYQKGNSNLRQEGATTTTATKANHATLPHNFKPQPQYPRTGICLMSSANGRGITLIPAGAIWKPSSSRSSCWATNATNLGARLDTLRSPTPKRSENTCHQKHSTHKDQHQHRQTTTLQHQRRRQHRNINNTRTQLHHFRVQRRKRRC